MSLSEPSERVNTVHVLGLCLLALFGYMQARRVTLTTGLSGGMAELFKGDCIRRGSGDRMPVEGLDRRGLGVTDVVGH